NADFKGDARARGRLGEKQGPDCAGQGQRGVMAALRFHGGGGGEDLFHVLPRRFLEAQEMFHGDSCVTTEAMRSSPSPASERDRFNGGSRRMILLPAGIASKPA